MTKARDIANAGTALSSVDATELGYLDGVTSNIQTQFSNISGSKAQPTEPSSPTDGMIWVDTDGSTTDANFIPKTLTSTTGDIIYASSANTPARLGIGSTGNVLTVSGGIPAWAAPVSGLTLITTASFSGSSAVNLNNIFTSTYTNYKVVWLYNGSGNVATLFRLRASGTDNTSNNYMWGISGIQYTGNAGYNEAINGALEPYWKIGFHGGAYDATWVADIFNPQATAVTSYVGGNVNPAASSPNVYGNTTTGVISVTTSYDGMTIYPASGTITGTYWIYGYQKA